MTAYLAASPVYRLARLTWLRWLQREMGPMHPCQLEVILEIDYLESHQ